MNMQPIVEDPALWSEYVKAYHIAGQYRPRVQFRKDLICLKANFIGNCFIYNEPTDEVLINADTGYVCEALGR
jgi:hypothetical protein